MMQLNQAVEAWSGSQCKEGAHIPMSVYPHMALSHFS